MQAGPVLFLSPQHIKQLCSPTCLASELVMQPLSLSLPLSSSLSLCSLSYTQMRGDSVASSGTDAGRKHGHAKISQSFELLMQQRECMHSRCGSLRARASGRRILLVSA